MLRVLTPQPGVPPTKISATNFDQSNSNFSNLKYEGENIHIPDSLGIYEVSSQNHKEELIARFIEEFGLQPTKSPNVWVGKNWALTINNSSGRYHLSNQLFNNNLDKNITYQNGVEVAQKFLEKYFNELNFSPIPEETEYFEGQHGDPAKTTSRKAKIIKLAFGYTIESFPVFYQSNSENFIEVYINSDKDILKVSFSPNTSSFNKIGATKTLTPTHSIQVANQTNRASIINTGYDSPIIIDFKNILEGSLRRVMVEYRIDTESKLAYPFYRFEGVLTDNNNQVFDAEIIAPAIELLSNH